MNDNITSNNTTPNTTITSYPIVTSGSSNNQRTMNNFVDISSIEQVENEKLFARLIFQCGLPLSLSKKINKTSVKIIIKKKNFYYVAWSISRYKKRCRKTHETYENFIEETKISKHLNIYHTQRQQSRLENNY